MICLHELSVAIGHARGCEVHLCLSYINLFKKNNLEHTFIANFGGVGKDPPAMCCSMFKS